MAIIHYTKRVYECIGVHIYSKATKSLNKLCWEMAYTWLFFGIGVPYYLFHPHFYPPLWMGIFHNTYIMYYLLLIAFCFCEFMNFLCHAHLQSFRKRPGDFRIGIPIKHGFSHVTCANYFWEFCAWIIFAVTNQSLISFIFLTCSFFRMNYRAQRKHLRYIAEFKKAYPAEERRAFLPYLF